MTGIDSLLLADALTIDEVASKTSGVEPPNPVPTFEQSQHWVKVSIAEAARMSVETLRIVAQSKAICQRSQYNDRSDGA